MSMFVRTGKNKRKIRGNKRKMRRDEVPTRTFSVQILKNTVNRNDRFCLEGKTSLKDKYILLEKEVPSLKTSQELSDTHVKVGFPKIYTFRVKMRQPWQDGSRARTPPGNWRS